MVDLVYDMEATGRDYFLVDHDRLYSPSPHYITVPASPSPRQMTTNPPNLRHHYTPTTHIAENDLQDMFF